MATRFIVIEGPATRGTRVSAEALQAILDIILEGSRRALRLRTQGRSTTRGTSPRWIHQATGFDVELISGSTVLRLSGPTIVESNPEQFAQRDLFPELDVELTAIDYFGDLLEQATQHPDQATDTLDKGMIEHIRRLEDVFDAGVTSVGYRRALRDEPGVVVSRVALAVLQGMVKQIPPSQQVRLAGKLDFIRESDRTFGLLCGSSADATRGIVSDEHLDDLQRLWRSHVLVTGTAHFSAGGRLLRVEASSLRGATTGEVETWSSAPMPTVDGHRTQLRVKQGSRSGLNALVGQWPGGEDDAELLEALAEMS